MTAAGPGAGSAPRGRPGLAVVGGSLLAWAMPGMLPYVGAVLVLPGLMACYAVLGSPRPIRDSYLFGCAFMAWFSWSVHHVLIAAYAGIVLVGGLYFVLGALSLRRVPRGRVLAFAGTVAAIFWLRAVMPEIYYPHGQPAHALYEWPLVLRGGIVVGGEPLVNALLAGIAGALVECWRGWRLGSPAVTVARRRPMVSAVLAVAVSLLGWATRRAPAPMAEIRIAAVEPGLHPEDPYRELPLDQPRRWREKYLEILEARLLAPTRQVMAEAEPPDLVLWPESALPFEVVPAEALAVGKARLPLPGPWPAVATRFVVGAAVGRDAKSVPAAIVVEPGSGRVVGHNEKRRLVPGGEFLPFANFLPEALAGPLRETFAAALGGALPDSGRGVRQPLLETAAGRRFGALICYDNAFPGPAAELVTGGAEFLVVLSNEAWYRGGAELAQLVAMSVCRTIETGVPLVRCTTDGWSMAIDRDGRPIAELTRRPAPTPAARILRTKLQVGPAADSPMAWLRPIWGPLAAIWLLLAILHGAFPWARLEVTRTAS
ncbi:MAG: apolipoprotein N-acyltransferase [Planctomycetes bacterium]|nr:apolipoprotein N-acyltransferase [Planctomycetota bacterium]